MLAANRLMLACFLATDAWPLGIPSREGSSPDEDEDGGDSGEPKLQFYCRDGLY